MNLDWHAILELAQIGLTALVIPLIKVLMGLKVELTHFNAVLEALTKRMERIENWQDKGRN